MGVRVEERRYEQPAAPVIHLAIRRGLLARRRLGAQVGDAPVAHADPLAASMVEVLVQKVNVREQHARYLSSARFRAHRAPSGHYAIMPGMTSGAPAESGR